MDDQPGLDRLAESDVVSDKERYARHAKGLCHRLELIVLDLDPGAKRRLQRREVCRRDRPPANGVHERCERLGLIPLRGFRHLREGTGGQNRAPWLHLPDDRELFPKVILRHRHQRHKCASGQDRGSELVSRQRGLTQVRNDPLLTTNLDEIPNLDRGCHAHDCRT